MQYGRHINTIFVAGAWTNSAGACRRRCCIRFCFPDAATTDAFRNRFGGECLTHGSGAAQAADSAKSDAPVVKRKAEERWADDHNENSLHLPRRDVGP